MISKLFCEMPVSKSLICDFKLGLQLSVSGDGKSIALFSMDNRCEDRDERVWHKGVVDQIALSTGAGKTSTQGHYVLGRAAKYY